MKLLVLLLALTCVLAHKYPAYIYNYGKSGAIKPQSSQEQYDQFSLSELLKHNFQLLNENNDYKQLIKEFGKGNLLNPVEMNYLFVIEGEEQADAHSDNVRVQVVQENVEHTILDEIYNSNLDQSLVRLTNQFFPREKRTPFYYYKSQGVKSESAYEKSYGIELKRDVQTNEFYFFDMSAQKKVGGSFELSQYFEQNFKEYKLQKDQLIKRNSSLKLAISEENVKDVENLMRDICAATKLSQMFKESKQPNFITFVLNYQSLENNELVQDLMKNVFKKVSSNFVQNFTQEKTFGEILYVPSLEVVEKKHISGEFTPRILVEEDDETAPEVSHGDGEEPIIPLNQGSKQFQAWFSLALMVTLFFVFYGLFTMEIQRDTLLYAKFIASDGQAR